jgi:hypothetical protein
MNVVKGKKKIEIKLKFTVEEKNALFTMSAKFSNRGVAGGISI